MPTPGSKIWYVDSKGAATNFGTAVTANVAVADIYRMTKPNANEKPTTKLWRGIGAAVPAGDVTAAQAEQDNAAVPSPDAEKGQPANALASVAAPAALTSAVAVAAPTKGEYDALRADVVALRTTVAALVTAAKSVGA